MTQWKGRTDHALQGKEEAEGRQREVTPTLLALALLSAPESHLKPDEALALAGSVLDAEKRYHLPPMLLAAVVLHESGGRHITAHHRHGCDVGPAQVYVPGCQARMRWLLSDQRLNVMAGARLLSWSRARCRSRPVGPCRRSEWALYNGGSSSWWPAVNRIWKVLRHAAGIPSGVA